MKKNVAASVRALLRNKAKEGGRPFQELLQYYVLERFLYRLSRSEYCQQFILKGALMLRVWETPDTRPTRDIDMLGYVDNSVENLEDISRHICSIEVEDDGLLFDTKTIAGERIKEDADYEGVRVKFRVYLEKAVTPVQIDIGFGNVLY